MVCARDCLLGRAWRCDELRTKGFEDLHKLWWVVIRERNMLFTECVEYKRLRQSWPKAHLLHKTQLSLARIKTILTERMKAYSKARELAQHKAVGGAMTEGELILKEEADFKAKISETHRRYRKKSNYIARRQSLFV